MTGIEVVGIIIGSLLGGGLIVRVVERFWKTKDGAKEETAAIKALQVDENAKIREELRQVEHQLREELRKVERDEAGWRAKYWEAIGARQSLETELHTMRPRFIDLIQQNQHLIAENETLKLKAGRRYEDQQTETLYRIEQAGIVAAAESAHVADELHASQGRADTITDGDPGEAADAASRSPDE